MKRLEFLRRAFLIPALCFGFVFQGMASPLTSWASDKEVETVWLGEPEHVWWETDTLGKWSSVKLAHEYQVKLYIADEAERDEENWQDFDPEDEGLEFVLTVRTSEKSYDFQDYMDDLHTYFFAVRAVPMLKEQAYAEAGRWIASPDVNFKESPVIGLTGGTWRNYLEGSRYEDAEGNLLGKGWHLIRGEWYLFDEDGYRLTGWQDVDGMRYYLGEDGRMAVGWFVYDGNWYYADPDSGQMQTGWIMTEPGKQYYLGTDGVLAQDDGA